MTERNRGRRETGRETTHDGSTLAEWRSGRFPAALRGSGGRSSAILLLGVLAAVLMAGSLLATVVSIDVAAGSCEVINDVDPELADGCVQTGVERHGLVYFILAVAVTGMAWGAARGPSRPAAAALVALGALSLAIAVASDVPAADETGVIGRDFAGAEARAGAGLWMEVAAGTLAAAAGLLGLTRPRPRRRRGAV